MQTAHVMTLLVIVNTTTETIANATFLVTSKVKELINEFFKKKAICRWEKPDQVHETYDSLRSFVFNAFSSYAKLCTAINHCLKLL